MNSKKHILWVLAGLIMIAASCVKPFNPPAISSANLNYLVVDGLIVPGSATTIKLSRTLNVADSFRFVPEVNAQLFIEGSSGSSITFQTGTDGVYTTPSPFLSESDQYRLRIKLSNGSEYLSDYVEVKKSPPIDNVEWEETDDIAILVNTHDPEGKARYYRWTYEETVEYRAIYESLLDYVNGQIIFLEPHQMRYICYKYHRSNNIVIANSSSLSEDVIRRFRITSVPNDNSKISRRYSILVKQHALTADAYKYWQILQANTEQNGNIFDPQPSQLRSNIHNVADPNEPVIGYLSASNITEKRIFITYFQLQTRPRELLIDLCDVIFPREDLGDYLSNGEYLPAFTDRQKGLAVAPAICVDCRLRGGSTGKPSYW